MSERKSKYTTRTYRIEVPLAPVAKGRPRMTRSGHVYTPPKTAQAEKDVARMARASIGGDGLLEGPLEVKIRFHMPMPQSWSKRKRDTMDLKAHCSKPDLDNLVKLVKDALNGIVWVDDSQVYRLESSKLYMREPMTVIEVRET